MAFSILFLVNFTNSQIAFCRSGQSPGADALVLRYSVRVGSPGCVAMVLEAVSPRPPYLLENRTRHLLLFRPLAAPDAPFLSLPPYAAAGFAPQSPATPAMVCHTTFFTVCVCVPCRPQLLL